MYSIRKFVLACGTIALGALLSGCQLVKPSPVARMNDTPLTIDPAMQKRDWERSTAYWANGMTVAGPTDYWLETADYVPDYQRRVVDPSIAALNMVVLPAAVVVEPPWKQKVDPGLIIAPTYSGQPPLK